MATAGKLRAGVAASARRDGRSFGAAQVRASAAAARGGRNERASARPCLAAALPKPVGEHVRGGGSQQALRGGVFAPAKEARRPRQVCRSGDAGSSGASETAAEKKEEGQQQQQQQQQGAASTSGDEVGAGAGAQLQELSPAEAVKAAKAAKTADQVRFSVTKGLTQEDLEAMQKYAQSEGLERIARGALIEARLIEWPGPSEVSRDDESLE